jgi:predicted transcriptional regulator
MSIRLPDSLHKRLRHLARREHVSMNQLVTAAVAEKLSALDTEEYLQKRAARASKKRFHEALDNVPDVPPDPADPL